MLDSYSCFLCFFPSISDSVRHACLRIGSPWVTIAMEPGLFSGHKSWIFSAHYMDLDVAIIAYKHPLQLFQNIRNVLMRFTTFIGHILHQLKLSTSRAALSKSNWQKIPVFSSLLLSYPCPEISIASGVLEPAHTSLWAPIVKFSGLLWDQTWATMLFSCLAASIAMAAARVSRAGCYSFISTLLVIAQVWAKLLLVLSTIQVSTDEC